jgi:hypothetical protein
VAKVTLTSKTDAMKSILPLLSLAFVFGSCTTAYKTGQTPDDVYFSPERPHDEYVRNEKKEDRMYRNNDEAYRDDRYLRMKVRDRRYSVLYDDYYSYNPYYYHYINGQLYYNSPWNDNSYWNYYYSPGHSVILTCAPRKQVYDRPRTFDLGVYNPQPVYSIPKAPRVYGTTSRTYGSGSNSSYGSSTNTDNYRGSGNNAGGFLRDVFGGGSSSGSSSTNSKSSSSGSSSSGSSSSGSSNAPTRKF